MNSPLQPVITLPPARPGPFPGSRRALLLPYLSGGAVPGAASCAMCRLGLEHWAGRRHISGCRSAPGIWHSSSMKSGLLLLPVLLALWAELSPASGQLRQDGDVCQLPPEPGPCLAYMPRYFYNPVTESCEMFIYGGCLGNGNRFSTKEECLRTCGQPDGDVCQLPPEVGPCKAYMPMYFYNPVTKSCERFIYGGCGGNGNRFATEEECLRACEQPDGDVCQLPPEVGPCKAYVPSYFYNPVTKSCEMFIYGGCKGNGNRFSTKEECLRTCGQPAGDVCRLPPEVGPCKARIPSYFYNPVTKSCERFIYGGCKGNGNRFATEAECLRTCGQPGKRLREIQRVRSPSTLVTETFLPRSLTSMITTDRLHPSSARAPTKEECLRTCGQPAGDVCQLPPDTGPCEAYMPMYFYNPVTKSCERFIYGGCKGNGNRFSTKEECLRACGQPAGDVCQLPPDAGPCEAHMTMYFYNPVTKSCETFIYGGCLGNGNRFETEEECLRACGQPEKPGLCPVFPPDTIGICALLCSSDNDCPGAQKCCSVGCGQMCLAPTHVRFSVGGSSAPGEPGLCHGPGAGAGWASPEVHSPARPVPCGLLAQLFAGCLSQRTVPPGNMNSPLQPVITLPPARPGPFPGSRRALLLPYLSGGAVPGAASCAMCRLGLEHWAGRWHISGCRSAPGIWHSSSMKSGLLLLPVLLALWAELSPASGQLRQAKDICNLPADSGPCFTYTRSYFYNPASNRCEEFLYGGCQGNGNRFDTMYRCLKTCGSSATDVCQLPKVTGPCKAKLPCYFYNPVTKSCERFIYGGCGGNGNRFATEAECLRACGQPAICKLPVEPGPCFTYVPNYFYNSVTKRCEEFIYGGCQGNENRFPNMDECLKICGSSDIDVCQLPRDPGPCQAFVSRYFYNSATKACEEFRYGGCQGNENRFATKEKCFQTCGRPVNEICKLPVDAGSCFSYMTRYFYNSVTDSCEEFIYGGCEGNQNRFSTKNECLKTCGRSDIDICKLPMKPGPCQAFVRRYFYNSVTKKCEKFRYGGCQGNENRFANKEECLETCVRPVNEVCKLPMDSGSCFSYQTRYFYNWFTRKCEAFTYGGCEGNGNRFASIDECLRTCGSAEKPGSCPATTGGLCILGCNDDDDCAGGDKCCSNGCGRTCQAPVQG
ncbi:papilin-like [Pelodiscus sinensis]|uniref:papilin-like n=1 Tax=Pelodiscus sinensis TaxID=13735 RepID=UPI003F6C701D